jgi:DNA repair protein RadC
MEIRTTKRIIKNPTDLNIIFLSVLNHENEVDRVKEHFWVSGMDTRLKIQYIELVSLGSLDRTIVHPREVFRFAIMKAVSAIVMCHNHPSGDPEPSQEDITLTKRLLEVGKIIGIEVLDHVIIANGMYVSLKEKGII